MTGLDPNVLAPRGFDDYYRTTTWIKDQLKLRRSSIGYLERATVPGSVTTIREILTNPTGPLAFRNRDTLVVEEPGDQFILLTYVPKAESLHVYWGPLHVPEAFCVLDGRSLRILDPDGRLRPNDMLEAYYSRDTTVAEPVIPPPPGPLLAFEAAGWKWLQIGRTDATDYSAAAFDDSGWATVAAAFGDGGDMAQPGLPAHTTLWQKTTRMWARRTLTGITPGLAITGTIRADEASVIYLDGVAVWSGSPNGYEMAVAIDAADVTSSSMVLAVRTTDGSSSLGCYFDLELGQ